MVFDLLPQEEQDPIDIFDRNCILILDESREAISYLDKCFSQQNFKVLSQTRGLPGIETATRSLPDCVLVNKQLIDMDGFDVCRRIVDDSRTCGIPVIMMGASAVATDIQNAKAAGGQYFIAKPIDPKALVFLVNESIAEARSWICD